MADIYFLRPDGAKESFPEEQIEDLRAKGTLYSFTYYWKEGMSDWLPVKELTGDYVPYTAGGRREFVKDPGSLTAFLKVMLWISVAVSVLAIGTSVLKLAAMEGAFSPVFAESIEGIAGLLYLLVYILTGVGFLKWIYRAGKNVRGFGAAGMKISAGWAVGYYFIPILNLFKPYRAMEEISRASKDPMHWQEQQPDPVLSPWWGLWIASNFLSVFSLKITMRAGSDKDMAAVGTVLDIFAELVFIPLCIVSVKMIKKIIAMQRDWVEGRVAQ